MPIKIHDKEYLTVAERIQTFRAEHKDWSIDTDLVSNADLIVIKAVICNETGSQIGSGYAEELRGSTNINKTSALENCETSAIGRALASCGYGGEQYASANEVSNAIVQQEVLAATDRILAHNKTVQENIESICAVKLAIAENRLEAAVEALAEINEDARMNLRLASTKGGIFTTAENKVFTSNEWSDAYKTHFGR